MTTTEAITESNLDNAAVNDNAADNSASVSTRKQILICDTQPVAVEGMKWLIENTEDLRFAGCASSLDALYELLHPGTARVAAQLAALAAGSAESDAPAEIESQGTETTGAEAVAVGTSDVRTDDAPVAEPMALDAVVIDKGLGIGDVMEFLQKHASTSTPVPAVVWGAISESEALKLLQAGAKGILRRTSESGTLLTCLRAVTAGGTWMEDGIFGSNEKLFNPRRSQLTQREGEVVLLVEKGLRNRDIAKLLGIQTGTVKIHLKHIFEKTGVRGRYGLAFTGLQNKGSIAATRAPQVAA